MIPDRSKAAVFANPLASHCLCLNLGVPPCVSAYNQTAQNTVTAQSFDLNEAVMAPQNRSKRRKVRGNPPKAQSPAGLAEIVSETVRLWRKHHLGYDQTKYVVEQARRRLKLQPMGTRANRSRERPLNFFPAAGLNTLFSRT